MVFWRLTGLHLLPSSLWCVFLSDASGHGSQSTKVINASRSTLLSLGVMVGVSAVTATTWSLSCSTSAEPPDLQCSTPWCLRLLSLIPVLFNYPKRHPKEFGRWLSKHFFFISGKCLVLFWGHEWISLPHADQLPVPAVNRCLVLWLPAPRLI